ncbi:expressed protein, partial [Phakopsora pachyrhizi]
MVLQFSQPTVELKPQADNTIQGKKISQTNSTAEKTSLTQNRMNWDRWQSERDGQEELWKERKKGGIRRLASSSQVLLDGEVKGMDSPSDT